MPRLEIEKYKNQSEWVESTLQEVEEQQVSSLTMHTPTMQENISKRSREEESPLGIDIFSEGFKIMYRKKAKISYRLSVSEESEQQILITSNEPLISPLAGDLSTQSPTTSTSSQEQQQIMHTGTSGAQSRLLSAFNSKKTSFDFDIKDIHPIDQMEMHK